MSALTQQALKWGNAPDRAAGTAPEIERKLTQTLAQPDDTKWADLLATLSSAAAGAFRLGERREAFKTGFFDYVDRRDDTRAAGIIGAVQAGKSRFADAHAYKMKAFNDGERAILTKMAKLLGDDFPQKFIHIGCGGTLETIMNMRDGFAADGMPLKELIGIDRRPQVLANGNAISSGLGLADIRLGEDPEKLCGPADEPAILCFAAYLYPDKKQVIDEYLSRMQAPAIVMVRNMTGPYAEITPPAALDGNAQFLGSSLYEDFSVKTDFYHVIPAA